MHVVQVLVSLNLGGSELVATELTEHLRAQNHRVTVIARNGVLAERIETCGAEHLDWSVGRKRLGTLRYINRLATWISEQHPDLIHVHSRLPAWICRLALRRLPPGQRPALVTSMHGHYSVTRYSAVMASGDRVIAVSDRIRQYTLHNYPGTDPARIVTVPGGVSRRIFRPDHRPPKSWRTETEDRFPGLKGRRWLCLPGRLSRYKGHADFIELLWRLLPDHQDLQGVIVGEAKPGSRYLDELEGLAEGYGVLDRIEFVGAQQDMVNWLAESEIVFSLCADPPEAFGRTVPEALHLGRPVIAWNHGGVAETLQALFPAGAVEPGNRGQLESRTREFLAQPPRVNPSQAYGLEESMQRTLDVYAALLDGDRE